MEWTENVFIRFKHNLQSLDCQRAQILNQIVQMIYFRFFRDNILQIFAYFCENKTSTASVFYRHVASYSWSVSFFSQVLKCEVELMAKMAKTIDGFTQNQTRLAVIIDGLDSCEQDKVLQMLDTVRVCLRYHAQPCIKHLPYNQIIVYKSFLLPGLHFPVYSTNAKKLLMAQAIHLCCKHKDSFCLSTLASCSWLNGQTRCLMSTLWEEQAHSPLKHLMDVQQCLEFRLV